MAGHDDNNVGRVNSQKYLLFIPGMISALWSYIPSNLTIYRAIFLASYTFSKRYYRRPA